MNITIAPGARAGSVKAISSKSHVHRLLIAAALSKTATRIERVTFSADVEATRRCLDAFLAQTVKDGDALIVRPYETVKTHATLDAGESGSTFRFLLPLVCALGAEAAFTGAPRLAARPLSPLYEELTRHGAHLSPQGVFPLQTGGAVTPGDYAMNASVSSQFFSGLLFALPLLSKDSTLTLLGNVESEPYLSLTAETLARFCVRTERTSAGFFIPGGQEYRSPGTVTAEGDWSNAAFFACLGALSPRGVRVKGLNPQSVQGDCAIADVLRRMGAVTEFSDEGLFVRHAPLHGVRIDASQIPDLVPALAVTACGAKGETVIERAGRLRLKESDRIESVYRLIRSLGGSIIKTDDGFVIHGTGRLTGGTAEGQNDHRIVMAAALAASICREAVTVTDAQAAAKSYPAFFEDFDSLEVLP